jgi:predicted nucleotide-binding protein (sugar kinase/HSP70/actin superfamily)
VSYRKEHQSTCLIVQGESYCLRAAFQEQINAYTGQILSPVLNFSKGWDTQVSLFMEIGKKLGVSNSHSKQAYQKAVQVQKNSLEDINKLLDETSTSSSF